jgi:AcrR family transcriptional regulator
MSPRKYDMARRAAGAAATRQRILTAALQVHAEQGIAAARLADIADRADVATATLYRHFDSYEELVAASCALGLRLRPPPTAETARSVFADVRGRRRRLRQLVDGLFGYYETSAPFIERLRRDSRELEAVAETLSRLETGFAAWVEEALRPDGGREGQLVAAIVDHQTWSALVTHAVADPRAAAVDLLDCAMGLHRRQ